MEDLEPPSSVKEPSIDNSLSRTLNNLDMLKGGDLEGVLLQPDFNKGEIAVLNPSLYQADNQGPWPFIYRTEIPNKNEGRHSIIDLRWLSLNEEGHPLQLSDKKTIISPEYDYEKFGCEDPRLTKVGDTYFITYVAFDGINARTALATTKDFTKITKHGIITPQIPLKLASKIVGEEPYKQAWEKHYLNTIKHFRDLNKEIDPNKIYPFDKDAHLDYNEKTKEWELTHRLEPNIQIARAKDWKDFQTQDYWEEHLKNIKEHTILKNTMDWASEKVGFNCYFKLGDKKVGLYHGVDSELNYRNSFFEIKNGKIESILIDPLIQPKEEDKFEYFDAQGIPHYKNVLFSTASLLLDQLWIYSGSGDQRINYYVTEIDWLYAELNHPHNREAARKMAA